MADLMYVTYCCIYWYICAIYCCCTCAVLSLVSAEYLRFLHVQ